MAPLTEDEHTVLFSLVSAIVDSGDPNATRTFYRTDEEWPAVQSLIRKGLALPATQPEEHYFAGFGRIKRPVRGTGRYRFAAVDPQRIRPGIEVVATAAGVELQEIEDHTVDEMSALLLSDHERGGQNRGSAAGHTLGDLAKVKKDMRKADFWLTADGQPTRTFKKSYIGIKIQRTDVLLPDYAYYMLMHLANQGIWCPPLTVEQVRYLSLQTAQ